MLSESTKDFLRGPWLLLQANIALALHMGAVYYLGKNSWASHAVVYGPITLFIIELLWKGYSKLMIASTVIAHLHGIAHVIYPFLDEHQGVVYDVAVWQDQVLHALQGALFFWLWYKKSPAQFNVLVGIFVCGLVLNVIVGYFCWGRECHAFYVWISLIPATAAGIHFAMGALFNSGTKTGAFGFALQGTSAIINYFLFRSSDDMLMFFARCRFFELYTIAPHVLACVRGKFNPPVESKNPLSPTNARRMSREFMQAPRRFSREILTPDNWDSNGSYFGDKDSSQEVKKNE